MSKESTETRFNYCKLILNGLESNLFEIRNLSLEALKGNNYNPVLLSFKNFINNCNSILDYTAFDLHIHIAKTIFNSKFSDHKVYFPRCENLEKFNIKMSNFGNFEDDFNDIYTVILNLQDFERGDKLKFINLLHDLDNQFKHRDLNRVEQSGPTVTGIDGVAQADESSTIIFKNCTYQKGNSEIFLLDNLTICDGEIIGDIPESLSKFIYVKGKELYVSDDIKLDVFCNVCYNELKIYVDNFYQVLNRHLKNN